MAGKATKKSAAARTPKKKSPAIRAAKKAAPASTAKFDQSGAPWWKKFWPTQPTAGKR
ncbi:MAG: hypothetical protein U0587_12410 [Candidatus Binatia bacterium]